MRGHTIFLLSTSILITVNNIESGHANELKTGSSDPPQEFCKNRIAVKRSREFLVDPVVIWSVTKITKMSKPYPQDLPTNKNVCSAFTFIEGCNMMRYTLTGWTPNYQNVQTIAYRRINNLHENIMVLDRTMTFKDKNYEVLYAEINKMVYVEANGETEVEKEIPKFMALINNEPILYAMVAYGQKDAWRIFQMCDRDVTWVVVPTDRAKPDYKKYMETYAEEINKKLCELKINTSNMVDIDRIDFPFEPANLLPPFVFPKGR